MAETMLTLHESPVSPVVLQETLRELVIDASAPLTLTLTAPAQTACSLVVRIRRAEALTIQVRAEAASQLTLLYWNESSAPITIRESNEIYRDARFKAAYVQLNPGMVDHQSKTLLKESGAEALVQSAVIAQTGNSLSSISFTRPDRRRESWRITALSCRADATAWKRPQDRKGCPRCQESSDQPRADL